MITMRNITKSYHMGENVVHALRGLDLEAVSYTHLDVYKRQALRKVRRTAESATHWGKCDALGK